MSTLNTNESAIKKLHEYSLAMSKITTDIDHTQHSLHVSIQSYQPYL